MKFWLASPGVKIVSAMLDIMTNTVFTRVSAVALFKFLVFQMRRLFGGGAYLRAALFKKC